MTTGSLGQGFSCTMGIAKASQLKNDGATIYTIIGDGETQEGQIWEAAMFASQHRLNNVIAFTDYNKLQLDGRVCDICDIEPLDKKWQAFNWNTIVVKDGHNCDEIDRAISMAKRADKPSMIILNTIKGKGVSFAENAGVSNHSMTISDEMLKCGLAELGGMA